MKSAYCCTCIFSAIKHFVCFSLCIEALGSFISLIALFFTETAFFLGEFMCEFVWDISKDAQKQTKKKKQIKGAQSKCGESFRQHPNDRESEAKTFFYSKKVPFAFDSSFKIIIGHRQHVNGFQLYENVDGTTLHIERLFGVMIGKRTPLNLRWNWVEHDNDDYSVWNFPVLKQFSVSMLKQFKVDTSIRWTIITIDFAIKFNILVLIWESLELRVYLKTNSNERDFCLRNNKKLFLLVEMSFIQEGKNRHCD